MHTQLVLDLTGNAHETVVYDFLERAERAALPGLNLKHTVAEHQDRWYRLGAIADELLAPQTARKEALRAELKAAATPAEKRRLHREIGQIEDAERDLHLIATNLWQVAHERLEAEVQRRHGLVCGDDDGPAGWFYNTLSHDRACEAFGALTLHQLAELALKD